MLTRPKDPKYYHKMFLEHHSIMLLIHPDNGEIIDVNQAAVDYYGYSKSELLALKISDINILTNVEIQLEMENARKNLREYFLFKHRKKNGEVRNVEVHSVPINIEGHQYLYSIIFDVTKRLIQESYFNQVFENADDAIAILDDSFRIHNVNKRFLSLFEFDRFEVLHKKIYEIMDDNSIETESKKFEEIVQNGNLLRKETFRTTKSGRKISVEIVAYPITVGSEIVGVYAYYIDISKKKEIEERLRNFTSVLENNSEGVVVTDEEGKVQWINKAFKEITFGHEALTTVNGRALFNLSEAPSLWDKLTRDGYWKGEINEIGACKIKKPSYLSVFSSQAKDGTTTGYIGILSDLSAQKMHEATVFTLAYRDSLTGLYNRAYLDIELDRQVERTENLKGTLSAVFLDIDKFKQINDTLGHQVGDEILKEYASRLNEVIEEEHRIFRFGGDEFLLLLPNTDHEDVAARTIPKIKRIMKKPFEFGDLSLYVESSIGVSTYPLKTRSKTELLKQADVAMYRAKESNRLYERFTKSMMTGGTSIANIQHLLRDCYRANAFYYEFTPFYDFATHEIKGYDAQLSCKAFEGVKLDLHLVFSVAKEMGLVYEVTNQLMTAATRYIQKLGVEPTTNFTFQLTCHQLENDKIVQGIIDSSAQFVNRECIHLLIVDDIDQHNKVLIQKNISRIQASGFSVGLDKIEQHSTTLQTILMTNPRMVKTAFLSDTDANLYDQRYFSKLVKMIKAMDVMVIVDGVNTSEDIDSCLALGCDFGQGNCFLD